MDLPNNFVSRVCLAFFSRTYGLCYQDVGACAWSCQIAAYLKGIGKGHFSVGPLEYQILAVLNFYIFLCTFHRIESIKGHETDQRSLTDVSDVHDHVARSNDNLFEPEYVG